MQPCAVCGGVQVDAAGYCTQCGTFRGVPHQPPPPPAYPQAPPPAYPGYPQPGSPPAYPTSVPPAGYPTSVPPAFAQQTSGGGYPGYQPHPPQRGRSFVVPLVALGSILVALVVAIVVVVAVRGNDEPLAGPTGTPTTAAPLETASAAPGGDLDQCVIGTWRVTAHKETVLVQGQGSVTFTGGEGATLRLKSDGTGETDYGSSTEYQGELNGETVRLEVSGRLTYDFTTRSGRINVSNVESTAEGKVAVGGEEYDVPNVFDTKDDSASYTCSTDLLTQNTGLLTTEYERVS